LLSCISSVAVTVGSHRSHNDE